MRRTTSVDLRAREPQLVLDRLGEQLAIVGELAVDEPRGEHDVADLEHHLVLPNADRQLGLIDLLRDASQLLEGAGGHVRLDRPLQRRLERRVSLTLKR